MNLHHNQSKNNLSFPMAGEAVTMSSREIAELTKPQACAYLRPGANNSFSQAGSSRNDGFPKDIPTRPLASGGGAENTRPFGGIIPLILCELLAPAFGWSFKPSVCGNSNCSTGGL